MSEQSKDDEEPVMPTPAHALPPAEEIALRSITQSLELHHRLNEATAIQRALEQPGITSLAGAKAAVQARLNALLVLDRQLHAASVGLDAAPPVEPGKGKEAPWH